MASGARVMRRNRYQQAKANFMALSQLKSEIAPYVPSSKQETSKRLKNIDASIERELILIADYLEEVEEIINYADTVEERSIVRLVMCSGLDYTTIGEIVGYKAGTVKNKMYDIIDRYELNFEV